MSNLKEIQIEREISQVDSGIDRYFKQLDGKDVGDTTHGRKLTINSIDLMAAAIEQLLRDVSGGKAGGGRPAVAAQYLAELDPVIVSYITARTCLQAARNGDSAASVFVKVSKYIEEHINNERLMEEEPILGRTMKKKAEKWTTAHHRRNIMRTAVSAGGVSGLSWEEGHKGMLGAKLVELFIETSGLIELHMVQEGKQRRNVLRPTAEMQEWLDQMEAQCSLLEPRYLPMLVPPVAWTSPLQGGYLTHQNRTDFIKDCKPELRDDLLSMDISQVYSAVNTIQATPWAVNEAVLDVMQELAGTGARIGGLPAADDMPVPQRPDDIPSDLRVADMDERTKARFDAWRFEAHAAYNRNVEERSKRLQLATQLTMAESLRGVEEFYFPHNVDFRGRVYSLVPEFNPQQSDLGKSLLQFAKGKPLGDSGAYWLAVHISNLFGNDKVPFDERVEWTAKHSAEIMDSAMSPLDGQRFWATADEPFQFLAACFEWTGYQVEGDEYVSVLPVAMDGSCSGLQHFSAMLKDEQGAQATNLCRQDRPSDIYTQVAEWVETYLEGEDEQLAAAWQGKVLRKIVKRPCMTFAYSVTSRGIRDQILDELRKQGEEFIPSHDNWELANYLAPVVEDGIRATVKRAAEAMDWLKVSVKTLLDNDTPVAWYTPLGFPVQQKYWQSTAKRYNVWFQGRRLRFNLRVDNTKPDARKMGSAVAPNFVHSMDATHLMMVVNRMQDEGITDNVAVIHDSFGVHACDTDELHAVIRDEFINLYSTDQLKVAHNYWEQAANAALAAPPELGEYDLEEVRDADFFFA